VFVDNPNVKGAVAEQAIVLAATKLHVPVWKPIAEHGRADLVLEIGPRLLRVQCKWGGLSPKRDVVMVATGGSRCSPNGYIRTTYTEDEIDLFGIYCGELDRCFLVPISLVAGRYSAWLRLTPTRNGQEACINLADDFDFEGAVAQLEERCHGMAEVRGSSPLSSTPSQAGPITLGSNPFRNRFGYWMDRLAAGDEVLVTRRGKPRIRLSPATEPVPALTPPAEPRTPRTAPR
jgi:antitoxin (DNA-binding transcriptional repressor) of toxin-antitoxin stability system